MRISVLMALYRPDRDWLKQQLLSLKRQTFPDVELVIADDCPCAPVGEKAIKDILGDFPFRYYVNAANLGTAKTFEKLALDAQGEYIAFCDQDDIWQENKLNILLNALLQKEATLVYCDLSVIDAVGKKTADDVRQIRKSDFFLEGENIAQKLLVKNCIYGCSTLMPARIVKEALPIPEGMGHDHWVTLWASYRGKVVHLQMPLVNYRIHGNNQSDTLKKIKTKQDYYEQRILPMQTRVKAYKQRFEDNQEMVAYICALETWVEARANWYRGDFSSLYKMLAGMRFSPKACLAELCMPFCTNFCLNKIRGR